MKRRTLKLPTTESLQGDAERRYRNVLNVPYYWVFGWTKSYKKVCLGPFMSSHEADGRLAELIDGEVFKLKTRDINRAVREVKAELMSRGVDADEALRRMLRNKGYKHSLRRR